MASSSPKDVALYEELSATTHSDYDGSYAMEEDTFQSIERYLIPILFSATFLCGVLGNGLVFFVILCMRRGARRKVTNIYLVNLAIADFLLLLICVPVTALSSMLPSWPFGKVVCQMEHYLVLTSMAASIWTMTALSIDRYCVVVGPNCIKPYRTVRSTLVVLGIIWVTNAILLSPVLSVNKLQSQDFGIGDDVDIVTHCYELYPSRQAQRAFTVGIFVGYYVLPLIIIAVSYFLMARNMWGNIGPGLPPACTVKAIRRNRHVCVMVLIMVGTFGVCWLPVHAVQLYGGFGSNAKSYEGLYVVMVINVFGKSLTYLNSALNPLIYSFMSHVFRQRCKEALATCHVCHADNALMVSPADAPGAMMHGGNRADRLRARSACLDDGQVIMPLKMTTSTDQNQDVVTPMDTSTI